MSLTDEILLAPTGSAAQRFTSRDPEAFEIPRGREEQWRFTPTRRLAALFEPFEPTATWTVDAGTAYADIAPVPMDDPRVGQALRPADRVAALAWANTPLAGVVAIPVGRVLTEPAVIRLGCEGGMAYGHTVIEAGAHAKGIVILEYTGDATTAANLEIVAHEGAELTVVVLHDWAPAAIHLAQHAILVGPGATVKHYNVALGGSLVRVSPYVSYAGPGGRAELRGISFAGQGQHFETRLYVEHSEPNCSSDVRYRNALLGDSARTVWVGDVRIRPSATGTDTYEANRNLLLSPGARADSVPNLEIETGQIAGAGHASATGRFDDEQLFYLQSRGIGRAEAQRLVVRGFFAEIISKLGLPDFTDRIMATIEARLGAEAHEDIA